ncbi:MULTISPECIES: DNA (cytosine-5-)-methyltransferase [unclassified Oleiphilus]|uniref:DNA (cytosine-5-)-methyltransferase n=1 Tax=unclassified Oleiphilus TaxID=2631174 RepID=UPI0009ED4CAE|nr:MULTISPECIES: DNA (cytosine-5-)-methyltransferase [unclassified Oleiphilus]
MNNNKSTLDLLTKILEIYDQKQIANHLNPHTENDWCRETINRILKGKSNKSLTDTEEQILLDLLPKKPNHYDNPSFKFIDLFAGIGGIRKGFDEIGGKCVFTSEWNKYSVRTYKANFFCDPDEHVFNEDITDVTLTNDESIAEQEAYDHIDRVIPDHDVLLAGFPCQPFSLAGVSKKNSLGRAHGFECETQGTLFFDVCRIIQAKQPSAFVLENVKNLKSHDKGNTFKVISKALDDLGYDVLDIDFNGTGVQDPKIIDGKKFLPQHRERIVLVGFRRDSGLSDGLSLRDISYPKVVPSFKALLDELDEEMSKKYTLTPRLWEYLYEYAKKHQAKGNGFGYGLVDPNDPNAFARTLSARYHKDGSEILIDQGWDKELGENDFFNEQNQARRPRRLTPAECARLMGFDRPGESNFVIPVSDTQAYRQFGNSVVVPVFRAVAELMKSRIYQAVDLKNKSDKAA